MNSSLEEESPKKKERALTEEEKKKICRIIGERMQSDDRCPDEVIKESYDGDREKYLRDMAVWHGVSLED